jgi:hypothetical protein
MDILKGISIASDFISMGGAVSAVLALRQLLKQRKEKKRLNEIVSVVLESTDKKQKIVPLMVVKRKDITRAELQGILGTIKMRPSSNGRYKLDHLNTKKFWQDIERLQSSDKKMPDHDKLLIPCSPEEIEQFDPSVIISC